MRKNMTAESRRGVAGAVFCRGCHGCNIFNEKDHSFFGGVVKYKILCGFVSAIYLFYYFYILYTYCYHAGQSKEKTCHIILKH